MTVDEMRAFLRDKIHGVSDHDVEAGIYWFSHFSSRFANLTSPYTPDPQHMYPRNGEYDCYAALVRKLT